VVRLATDNLAALPAERIHEHFGNAALPSVADRGWLAMSLAELGRFADAAEYEAEAMRLAESTRHPYTVGVAHRAAGMHHLLKGNWVKARALFEHEIGTLRTANIVLLLPHAIGCTAWVLAQLGEASEALNRLREAEQLLDRQQAVGMVGHRGWVHHALGRACLLLGQLDEARSLGDRVVETSLQHPGFAAHAQHLLGDIATHPDRFDAESGEAYYGQALAFAEPRGMRPLVAHRHLGLGKLYRRAGRRQEAQEHLTTATAMYREMDMHFWLEKAEAEMKAFGDIGGELTANRPAFRFAATNRWSRVDGARQHMRAESGRSAPGIGTLLAQRGEVGRPRHTLHEKVDVATGVHARGRGREGPLHGLRRGGEVAAGRIGPQSEKDPLNLAPQHRQQRGSATGRAADFAGALVREDEVDRGALPNGRTEVLDVAAPDVERRFHHERIAGVVGEPEVTAEDGIPRIAEERRGMEPERPAAPQDLRDCLRTRQ